jgi:hypothetical protein
MDDHASRLRDAGGHLLDLRGPLGAGEPWPLSAAYGTEPEADWGPREVLAHVNEMLPYWATELRIIIAGDPSTATPFGRVSSDPERIGRIAADRALAVGDLLDRIAVGLGLAEDLLAGLTPADLERRGMHATQGELTVREAADRFIVGHLTEHVEQLQTILIRRAGSI